MIEKSRGRPGAAGSSIDLISRAHREGELLLLKYLRAAAFLTNRRLGRTNLDDVLLGACQDCWNNGLLLGGESFCSRWY